MFRAAVLSIAFTLAVGQHAVLMCIVRCDAPAPVTSGCHDENASVVVAGDDSCYNMVPDSPVLAGADVRRSGGASHTQLAAVVPRYQFAPSVMDVRSGREPGEWRPEKRPLVTLRI